MARFRRIRVVPDRPIPDLRALIAAVFAMFAVAFATVAHAATIKVNTTADEAIAGDGACSLREAINNANAAADTTRGDCTAGTGSDAIQFTMIGTILLDSSLPTITRGLTITGPAGPPGLTVSGGFAVQIMQVASGARLNLRYLTLEDGNVAGDGGAVRNAGTLLASNTAFNGNQVSGNPVGENRGAAIFNVGQMTITNSAFSGNQTASSGLGGAIYNDGTSIVTSAQFTNNHGGSGGAIYNDNLGNSNVTASTFSDNQAGAEGLGGAIANDGVLNVTDGAFIGNLSGGVGGAILNSFDGVATIAASAFNRNYATSINSSGGGAGGAIYNLHNITVTNCGFAGNQAQEGGAITHAGTMMTVAGSTFSANQALGFPGGAIDNAGGMIVTNTTFSRNTAPSFGGAIENVSGPGVAMTVISSTFSGNSASAMGGAAINNEDLATINLANNIVAASVGPNCGGVIANDFGFNISDDNSCGFSALGSANNLNPELSPSGLQNNGGSTETVALQPTSPAIDAVPFPSCLDAIGNQLAIDQRGLLRLDLEDGGAGACDIGAYESQAPVVVYPGFDGNLTITNGEAIVTGTVSGSVIQTGGNLVMSNATIKHNLQITGGTFSIAGSAVGGNVQVHDLPSGMAQNQICATRISGTLQIQNNATAVAVGAPALSCPGDTIGGELQVTNNAAAVQLFDVSAKGNLQCQGNAAIFGAGDFAPSLQGQCSGFQGTQTPADLQDPLEPFEYRVEARR